MASTTQGSTDVQQDASPQAQPATQSSPPVASDTESGSLTTEEAKATVVASDEGDAIRMPNPAGEGEIFVGSVSKVAEDADSQPLDLYNGQCSLCAQSFEGEDQQEVTDQLNNHYLAAHVYYNGTGL